MNDKHKSSVIIREENEEVENPNEDMNDTILQDVPNIPVHTHPQQEPTQERRIPPISEWLAIEKPVIHPEYDILNELKMFVSRSLYYKLLRIYQFIVK